MCAHRQLGLSLEGESANSLWGVLDAVVVTDFPDIRLKSSIQSKDAGSILVVPREKDLVRFYVQMGSTDPNERFDRSSISPESIVATAQRIFAPFKLECRHIDWWTIYEVGQRLCKTVTLDNRVFLAGDAFHTHSPKAGQGMNTSMMDRCVRQVHSDVHASLLTRPLCSYNLGWKIAHVVQRKAAPSILDTYGVRRHRPSSPSGSTLLTNSSAQLERHKVARELIDYDWKLSRMFAGKPITSDGVRPFAETAFPREFEQLTELLSKTWRALFACTTAANRSLSRTKSSRRCAPLPDLLKYRRPAHSIPHAQFYESIGKWASGTAVHYLPNALVAPEREPSLAPGLPHGQVRHFLARLHSSALLIGSAPQRFESHAVVALADARPWHLADRFLADGRWRLVLFAGDVREPQQRDQLEQVRGALPHVAIDRA